MNDNTISFAQRIRIRLFMEGIELPIISAHITGSPNSPATCAIQIPPLVEGTRLLPRTLVHLFFLDAYESANPFLLDSDASLRGPKEQEGDPTDEEKAFAARAASTEIMVAPAPCGDVSPKGSNIRYKLCFGGEVVGFQWTKNPMSRSLILQCEDWSNYWDYAYQWSNTCIFGPGMKAMFSGGSTNLFTDFLSSQGSVLVSIMLQGKCNTFPRLGGLAAGIVRLVEAIGGSYYVPSNKRGLKKFAGQNIFFSIAELRLHMTQMVAVYEDDPTSKRLLSRHGYDGMFNRALGGLGQQVSIRKAMAAIMRIMFHEVYPQPCPRYKPGSGTDPQGTRRVRIDADPRLKGFADTAATVLREVEAMQLYLEGIRALTSEEYKAQSGDVQSTLQSIRTKLTQQAKLMHQGITTMPRNSAPEELSGIYSVTSKVVAQAAYLTTGWAPNNVVDKKLSVKLEEAASQLTRTKNLTVNRSPLKEAQPARLLQHILRPDIWFGAPPRCNVLFPDMYEQLSYQRMFLQEPTRFLLKTNDEFFGEDFLFDKFYFAPQAGTLSGDKANMQTMLRNGMLDHELFTGILPVFEKMGEFNVFAARDSRRSGAKIPKVGFAQRSTNFLYFKHRFNARQFQVSGRFNPYVAVGFPGLVIDKWVDRIAADKIRDMRETFIAHDPEARNAILPKYTQELIGANFLANFVEVTHSLSQQQLRGNTTIRCNYARQVDEGVEFLGVAASHQKVQKRQDGDARRTTVVAATSPPDLHSIGPNQGVIVNVQEVTDKYRVRDIDARDFQSTSGQNIPVYFSGGGMRREGGVSKLQRLRVPVGVRLTARQLPASDSALLTSYLGSPDQEVVFRAYAVVEDVPRYKLEEVDLPAEELIRPGWYGDAWSPGNIGKVYQDFFGVGAITEHTVVLDGGPNANEAFEQAVADAQTAEDADQAVADLPIVTSLGQNATIQQAVEFLTLTYSYVKTAGLDADEFIRAYTWRPIATLLDLLGSEDLEFDPDGIAPIAGVEGFHSRAFGPYDDLFGLFSPEVEDILGIKRGDTAAQKGDTRKRRQERVQALSAALTFGRANVG
jgi:hypothetical protein